MFRRRTVRGRDVDARGPAGQILKSPYPENRNLDPQKHGTREAENKSGRQTEI
jgi:hypothetical protein